MRAVQASHHSRFSLLRGSGLKYENNANMATRRLVLPLTREWIEMASGRSESNSILVLPLTREWIEIFYATPENIQNASSPSYEGVD